VRDRRWSESGERRADTEAQCPKDLWAIPGIEDSHRVAALFLEVHSENPSEECEREEDSCNQSKIFLIGLATLENEDRTEVDSVDMLFM
jgi:hypothetical protein